MQIFGIWVFLSVITLLVFFFLTNMYYQLWDLIEGRELFQQIHDAQGRYDPKAHLAEMVTLFGPPPPELVERSHSMLEYTWPEAIKREDGKLCENAKQYFGGPFFDKDRVSILL